VMMSGKFKDRSASLPRSGPTDAETARDRSDQPVTTEQRVAPAPSVAPAQPGPPAQVAAAPPTAAAPRAAPTPAVAPAQPGLTSSATEKQEAVQPRAPSYPSSTGQESLTLHRTDSRLTAPPAPPVTGPPLPPVVASPRPPVAAPP